ncbi:MAG TPA: hypothetical protein VLE21_00105 [Candidatus Nitrosocosmicus sp.]|nr:hypothetical protein [Candidatus Nitrosocosmicus sp.]
MNSDTLDHTLLDISLTRQDINWIKMDVECTKLEVLQGAEYILSENNDLNMLVKISWTL